jgi:hypothetical protein
MHKILRLTIHVSIQTLIVDLEKQHIYPRIYNKSDCYHMPLASHDRSNAWKLHILKNAERSAVGNTPKGWQ